MRTNARTHARTHTNTHTHAHTHTRARTRTHTHTHAHTHAHTCTRLMSCANVCLFSPTGKDYCRPVKWGPETSFPNLLVSLRTFLAMCVRLASCERVFLKLNLIRAYLCSRVGHKRLSSLPRSGAPVDLMRAYQCQ